MPLETAVLISDLQPDWPTGTDPKGAGDDHIRLIKASLQATFPEINAPLTATAEKINRVTNQIIHYPADNTDPLNPIPETFRVSAESFSGNIPLRAGAASPQYMSTVDSSVLINWAQVQNLIYPVGILLVSENSVNPSSYLGFGTWEPRYGYLAAVGDVADAYGKVVHIDAGANHGQGAWRIQTGHISTGNIAFDLDTTSGGEHEHNYSQEVANNDTSTEGGGTPTYYTATGVTTGGGSHSHSVGGSISIGQGTPTDGPNYMMPYHGVYLWARTA